MASSPAHLISVFSTSKQVPPNMSPPLQQQPIQNRHLGVILSMATTTKFNTMGPSPMLIDHIYAAKHSAHPQNNPVLYRYLNAFTRTASRMLRFLGKSIASLLPLQWKGPYSWWISMLRMSECNWKGCYGL